MISFKQFLAEADDVANWRKDVEAIAEIIKRDCGPYIAQSGGRFMYRGFYPSAEKLAPVSDKVPQKMMTLGTVRKDRRPKDSPQWLHDLMNKKLVEKTGHPLRSQSLFTIGKLDNAEKYGVGHIIFPIGDFTYAWSEKIADPTHEFYLNPVENATIYDETTAKFIKQIEKAFFQFVKSEYPAVYAFMLDIDDKPKYSNFIQWVTEKDHDLNDERNSIWIKFIKQYIENNDLWISNEGLSRALGSYKDHEVMIACDKFYAVSTHHVSTSALQKFLK